MTTVKYRIETLDGKSFMVTVPRCSLKVMPFWFYNGYKYNLCGLDYLKEVICQRNGVDPISQQLFISDNELTMSTPLLPLENKTLTLIIKPSFQIKLTFSDRKYVEINNEKRDTNSKWYSRFCYLCKPPNQNDISLTVLGRDRDHYKILLTSFPLANIMDNYWMECERYQITESSPKYGWIRHDDNLCV